MSFYGNPKRVNSSPFIFDRIYPNRKTMETHCADDNIYVGRYVLVKYTTKFEDAGNINSKLETFDKYTESNGVKTVSEKYQNNATADLNEYGDTYDATIWQKVYTSAASEDGSAKKDKYILIAEGNAAVPRLELEVTSPKYYDQSVEVWNEPTIIPEKSSEDAYTIQMPNILHLEVGEMGDDFYGKALIDNPAVKSLYADLDISAPPEGSGISATDWANYSNEEKSHIVALSSDYNYMRWTNMYYDNNNDLQESNANNNDPIDAKQLDTKLYAFGQLISDLYDVLYGAPANGESGVRPFYTNELADVIQQYDKGLVGILSSIATDAKGDGSQDLYKRSLQPGMYYYFTSKWNDAIEDPNNFIENIPEIIGARAKGSGYAHYWIDFNAEYNSEDPDNFLNSSDWTAGVNQSI